VLGFSFKAGTDDLRESPVVELIERLIGKGYELRLFDHNVTLARLIGANREYILKTIPHIAKIMVGSIEEVLAHGELIMVGTSDPRFHDVASRLRPGQVLLDLVRLPGPLPADGYDGINW
jgi:GDP-mannose 6-dehydrogenase